MCEQSHYYNWIPNPNPGLLAARVHAALARRKGLPRRNLSSRVWGGMLLAPNFISEQFHNSLLPMHIRPHARKGSGNCQCRSNEQPGKQKVIRLRMNQAKLEGILIILYRQKTRLTSIFYNGQYHYKHRVHIVQSSDSRSVWTYSCLETICDQ